MQSIKFSAKIENGVVHIPSKYHHLQQQKQANFIVLYEDVASTKTQTKDSIFDKFQIDFSHFKFDREYANRR